MIRNYITSSSLRHPTIQWDLHAAMLQAIEMSRQNQVAGQATLKCGIVVHHSRYNGGLRFFDKSGRNISDIVKKALRSN